jgi:hypothetical protein
MSKILYFMFGSLEIDGRKWPWINEKKSEGRIE